MEEPDTQKTENFTFRLPLHLKRQMITRHPSPGTGSYVCSLVERDLSGHAEPTDPRILERLADRLLGHSQRLQMADALLALGITDQAAELERLLLRALGEYETRAFSGNPPAEHVAEDPPEPKARGFPRAPRKAK